MSDKPPFELGDHVLYQGKTYRFPGEVCAITDDGQIVVRAFGAPNGDYAGMKHIFGPSQLVHMRRAVSGKLDEQARAAVWKALTDYFVEHTGFSVIGTDEEKPTVSASYGRYWVELRVDRMADAVLQALRPGSTGEAEGWRPIETAPHEELVVLGWSEDGVWKQEIALASAGQRNAMGYSNRWLHGWATHWMPLPSPPSTMLAAAGGRDE